jgi:hypothetical protein
MLFNYERFKLKTFAKGGGGGSSGTSDFPDYMKAAHGGWLDDNGADTLTNSVTALIEAAHGSSPYTGETAYAPDSDITAFLLELTEFDTVVDALSEETDWTSFMGTATSEIDDNVISDASLDAEIAANDAIIDDRITAEILPRFQAGMRDINAVISSSFVVGKAVIESFAQRDKDKFAGDLRLAGYGQRNEMIMRGGKDIISLLGLRLEFLKQVAHVTTEDYRIKAVLKKEELQEQLDIDERDGKWDLEMFAYGNNVLASISGAAIGTGKETNKLQSAVGGALVGGAAAAVMGVNPMIGVALGIGQAFL